MREQILQLLIKLRKMEKEIDPLDLWPGEHVIELLKDVVKDLEGIEKLS